MAVPIALPPSLAKKILEEARKRGVTIEEYIVDFLTRDFDPSDRAREYVEVALYLLDRAREELKRGDVRQAAEKTWGAAALAVKAYAMWKDGRRLTSHGELWDYESLIEGELGEWVYDAWMAANGMHTCFYEGWCKESHVETAIKHVEGLVKTVAQRLRELKNR